MWTLYKKWKKTAGNRWTCFGVRVPTAQNIGLLNHKLKSVLKCTAWSQWTPVPDRRMNIVTITRRFVLTINAWRAHKRSTIRCDTITGWRDESLNVVSAALNSVSSVQCSSQASYGELYFVTTAEEAHDRLVVSICRGLWVCCKHLLSVLLTAGGQSQHCWSWPCGGAWHGLAG